MEKQKIESKAKSALLDIQYRNFGSHFTQCPDWRWLEENGFIEVERPVHGPSGIGYSEENYRWELTDAGLDLMYGDRFTYL